MAIWFSVVMLYILLGLGSWNGSICVPLFYHLNLYICCLQICLAIEYVFKFAIIWQYGFLLFSCLARYGTEYKVWLWFANRIQGMVMVCHGQRTTDFLLGVFALFESLCVSMEYDPHP